MAGCCECGNELWSSMNWGISGLSGNLVASQEGLFSMELVIPEQHTGKARNQGTTENSHTGYCTRTLEVLILKYKIYNMGNSSTHATNCGYRIAATLYTLETWFVACI